MGRCRMRGNNAASWSLIAACRRPAIVLHESGAACRQRLAGRGHLFPQSPAASTAARQQSPPEYRPVTGGVAAVGAGAAGALAVLVVLRRQPSDRHAYRHRLGCQAHALALQQTQGPHRNDRLRRRAATAAECRQLALFLRPLSADDRCPLHDGDDVLVGGGVQPV
jgi:hypothetical protein